MHFLKNIWVFTLGITLFRILIATQFTLGVDEAHYALYGQHLAWSYFDHPPLIGWIHSIFQALFGVNEFSARLPAILIGALSSIMTYHFILDLFESRRVAMWSVFALNSSLLISGLFMMLLPDTPLIPLTLATLILAGKLERDVHWKNWLSMGLVLGLSGLSKYTAIFIIPALIIYFVWKKCWDLILSKNILITILTAGTLIFPVLYWNFQNDFVSFHFQKNHVLDGAFSINHFGKSLAMQFVAYGPFLFWLALLGFFKSFHIPLTSSRWRFDTKISFPLSLLGLISFIYASFFIYSSFYEVVLPHWSIIFYTLTIPLGTACALQANTPRWLPKGAKISILLSALFTTVLHAEILLKLIPAKDYHSVHRDIYQWDLMVDRAGKILNADLAEKKALAVTHWTLGSRVLYYSQNRFKAFVIDDRFNQYDFWQKNKAAVGYDLLFITTHFHKPQIAQRARCHSIEPGGQFKTEINDSVVNSFTYTWCRNFQGLK